MAGGAGNDIYVVDNIADVVTEAASAGTDRIDSSVTFTLGANVENLTLTGTAAINATGNTLNNALTGNTGANRLDGGAGNDTMAGGTGDDVYVVDIATDVVTEAASAGIDRVESLITYTLGANVENLVLAGTTAINATGNTLANTLTGNAAANVLNGGAGADTMSGGLGDDIYVVDNVADVVTEAASAGIDRIDTSITTTLGANVENLTLTGTTAINGTGNTLNNVITGNSGANVLNGGAGNDTLTDAGGANVFIGGAGNDTLNVTSTGIDRIAVARGHGIDTVIGTGTAANDVLEVSNGITKSVMGLIKTGSDLIIDLGASETITLKNWYATTSVRNVGTLKIIGDAGWVPGQTGTPTQVETLNMASLVTAFDAWRVANPTLTRWPLDSFVSGTSLLSTASISDAQDELVAPISTATAAEAYVPSNLKSLMKFYAPDPAAGANDWIRGAPRTVAAPVTADEPVAQWARIQPVARTAPWWEQSDIAAVAPLFGTTGNLGQKLSWQQVHSELALQLSQHDSDNDGAPPLPKAVEWETASLDNYWAKALAEDAPRLIGGVRQKMR